MDKDMLKARIIKALEDHGALRYHRLSSLCNVSYDEIRSYLIMLRDEGLVKSTLLNPSLPRSKTNQLVHQLVVRERVRIQA
jgi:DeoR/GlpR family transcriptional regulator of sugar metabolism